MGVSKSPLLISNRLFAVLAALVFPTSVNPHSSFLMTICRHPFDFFVFSHSFLLWTIVNEVCDEQATSKTESEKDKKKFRNKSLVYIVAGFLLGQKIFSSPFSQSQNRRRQLFRRVGWEGHFLTRMESRSRWHSSRKIQWNGVARSYIRNPLAPP